MNFINGKLLIRDGTLAVHAKDQVINLPNYRPSTGMIEAGRPVVLGVRPERLVLGNGAANDGHLSAVVDVYESLGAERVIWATVDGQMIAIRAGIETERPAEGATLSLGFASSSASLFDAASGERI